MFIQKEVDGVPLPLQPLQSVGMFFPVDHAGNIDAERRGRKSFSEKHIPCFFLLIVSHQKSLTRGIKPRLNDVLEGQAVLDDLHVNSQLVHSFQDLDLVEQIVRGIIGHVQSLFAQLQESITVFRFSCQMILRGVAHNATTIEVEVLSQAGPPLLPGQGPRLTIVEKDFLSLKNSSDCSHVSRPCVRVPEIFRVWPAGVVEPGHFQENPVVEAVCQLNLPDLGDSIWRQISQRLSFKFNFEVFHVFPRSF